MKANEIIKEQIFEIIENQIVSNTPQETKLTLERLSNLRYNNEDARALIGQCVAVELFNVLKLQRPFSNDRYISNLRKLPEEPFDD